jgi:ADP-ribose pyrophosphatase YjhB (NUDIX family)
VAAEKSGLASPELPMGDGSVAFMGRSAPRSRAVTTEQEVVRAAGGIVLRHLPGGRREVAVVHRPGRDDWSLPKGKLATDETFEDCALREEQEETGLRCRLGRFIGSTEYRDRRDRPKIVSYFLMDPLDGEFAPSDEVDEMRWLELTIARRALSYERDRDLLATLDSVVLAASG